MKSEDHVSAHLAARLKTRYLTLLVALGDFKTMHAAADAIDMAQPAASTALRTLEDVLGVRLFERFPRGLVPTAYGEIMIREARIVLDNLQNAVQEVARLRDGVIGNVKVGCIMETAMVLIPQTIARVKARLPGLQVTVSIETSNVLLDKLASGEFHVLVARLLRDIDTSPFAYEPIGTEPSCLVVRTDHPLRTEHSLQLHQLMHVGWIVPPKHSVLHGPIEMMFREAGLNMPSNLVCTTSLSLIIATVLHTDMVAVLPVTVADRYAQHGMLKRLPIELTCGMDPYGIITRRNLSLPKGPAAVLEALRESVAFLRQAQIDGGGVHIAQGGGIFSSVADEASRQS